LFPETELPEHPELTPKEELLLMRRHDLAQAIKRSPFFLETKAVDDRGDIDARIERWADIKTSTTSAAAAAPNGGADGAAAQPPPRKRARTREPLSSVVRLLPEYFPDELYSSSDRRAARLQDAYWARAGKKDDTGALHRLEALAALEGKAGAQGEGEGDGEAEPIEEVVDTDDEEEMDDDDYYKGAHFDDDEGYDDGFDDGGGDDGPVF